MTLPRRKFLLKSFLGCVSLSVLPPSFSFLSGEDNLSFLADLFSRLSIKQGSPLFDEFDRPEGYNIVKKTTPAFAFKADHSAFIQEKIISHAGLRENIVDVYQRTGPKWEHVISLNQLELKGLHNMTVKLMERHHITDPERLRKLIIPVFRKDIHRSQRDHIESIGSSLYGYYTDLGYCSVHTRVKGNRFKLQTALLNSRKKIIYRDNHIIENFI